jgi:hypothetical protein
MAKGVAQQIAPLRILGPCYRRRFRRRLPKGSARGRPSAFVLGLTLGAFQYLLRRREFGGSAIKLELEQQSRVPRLKLTRVLLDFRILNVR